jgi:hypothetical protein
MLPKKRNTKKPKSKPKEYIPRKWSLGREVLIAVIFIDPKNTNKTPGIGVVYASDIKSGISILRKAGCIPNGAMVLSAYDFSEADADINGIVLSVKSSTPEYLLNKAKQTKKGSFAELFKECELYNKADIAVLLVELDILLNPDRYPGILPYKPDTQTLIDSYAASRGLLEVLMKERKNLLKESYLHIKKEDLGIFETEKENEIKKADPPSKKREIPPLSSFIESYENGVESLCQLIEELRDEVLMSDVVTRLYEIGLTNNEVKNFYKYYYTIWKGGNL